MKTFALVGKTGTGKSFRALEIAKTNEIDAIIDDGLLIFESKILAGSSAKHEKTRIASVKRAIFESDSHAESVRNAIFKNNINSVLILGTSEKMVNQIAKRLELLPIDNIIKIEEIATSDEIAAASMMRTKYGKHIIPAPVFEVKKQFSGYFLKAFLPQGKRDSLSEKTVMRPTYSYLGNFRISPKVFSDICRFVVLKIDGVFDVYKIKTVSCENGCVEIFIEVGLCFPCDIANTASAIQNAIAKAVEDATSIIVQSADVSVKTLSFN